MNHTLELILLFIAVVCFGAATVNFPTRINLIALGLLSWVLTVLIPQIK